MKKLSEIIELKNQLRHIEDDILSNTRSFFQLLSSKIKEMVSETENADIIIVLDDFLEFRIDDVHFKIKQYNSVAFFETEVEDYSMNFDVLKDENVKQKYCGQIILYSKESERQFIVESRLYVNIHNKVLIDLFGGQKTAKTFRDIPDFDCGNYIFNIVYRVFNHREYWRRIDHFENEETLIGNEKSKLIGFK